MELIIMSLGLLCITFWSFFSKIFGKFARMIICALFIGLAFCGVAVVLYTEPVSIVLVVVFTVGLVYYDFKKVYDNYGYSRDDVFTFFNKELVKVAVIVLSMCMASYYALTNNNVLSSLFENNSIVKIFYCLAMTGLVAIIDASKQYDVYDDFEASESDPLLTGYVVGYQGKNVLGKTKLVIEVDLDEYKSKEEEDVFAEYRNVDRKGNFDGSGRFVKYDNLGRRKAPDNNDVRCANKLAKLQPSGKGHIVYFITAMHYDKSVYYFGRNFFVRYNAEKKMLYVEDEVQSNKEGLKICMAVGLFAFFSCLTYFVRNM